MHSIFRVNLEMKLIVNIWVKIKLGQRNQVLNVKYKINASLIEIEIVVWWESKIYYEGISWSWNLELTRYVCIVVTADNLYILVDRSSNSTHRYINFTCCCVRFCWKVLVSSPPSSSSKKSWQNGECEKRRRCCESIAVSNAILIELMIFGVRYVTTATSMKRKKHHTEKSRIIGLLVASFLRGRLLHRTLIIAISACLLLLFALFSLFAPSTLNKINLQTTQNNDQVRSRFHDSVFQVPVSY